MMPLKVSGISLEKLTHTVPKMVKGAFYGFFSIVESDKFHRLVTAVWYFKNSSNVHNTRPCMTLSPSYHIHTCVCLASISSRGRKRV